MSIICISCQCSSSDSLLRNFLKGAGYRDWLSIPIEKGRERSRAALQYLPRCPERDALDNFLKGASKWAVIIGYNQEKGTVRWSDIAHRNPKVDVEASLVVENFA